MIYVGMLIAIVCVVVDQLTKLWLYGKSLSLIGDFLWIQTAFNEGAAFGSLNGARWFFIVLAVPVIALLIYFLISKKIGNSKLLATSIGLIIGGTIGNVIDRLFLAGVRDFIYFKSINFAIFNFADVFICVGTALLIVYILFVWKPKSTTKEDSGGGDKQ